MASVRPLVLVGGEDAHQLTLLEYILDQEGFRTFVATDGDVLLKAASDCRPQLVLLDECLPPSSGVVVCRQLRLGMKIRGVPIIIVATGGAAAAPAEALSAGADEYLVKPIVPATLVARMRAMMRRLGGNLSEGSLRFADMEMDLIAYRVWRNGHALHLAPTEFRLLRHLMGHPGRVFSRDELVEAAWSRRVHVESRTVDVHMGRLRKVIRKAGKTDLIRTVRSVGYALSE